MKCLGIVVSTDREQLIELNYTPIVNKMNKTIQFWNRQHMTMFGKVVIINSYLISQFVYLMSVLPTPSPQIIKQIDAQLYTFLWSNKTERIKRQILKNEKQLGGISMPDIVLKDKGLKIHWVQRLYLSSYLSEFLYISTWIKNADIWKCNLETKDINVLFQKTPNTFNRDLLLSWVQYTYNTPETILEIQNQFIWHNSHIRIDGKPTYHKTMYKAGITLINHLLNQQGTFLTYQEFMQKYTIHVNFVNYLSIIDAIPVSWKKTLIEKKNDKKQDTFIYPIDKIKNTKSKICKKVYREMQQKNLQKPENVFNKWKNYFNSNLTMEDWLSSFELAFQCTKFIDLQYFHFRMLHQILANNEALYKWKLTDSDLCSFCNEEIETIYHTYLECEVVKCFWKALEKYLHRTLRVHFPITNQEIILGFKGDDLSTINVIYLSAKKYLYKCRCSQSYPRIETYIPQLKILINNEKGIYVLNNNYEKYLDRWGYLANR